ncbi:MAG TPA: 2-C-methyl-D-erythritol 4-phosphate cytidylyltransferase [Fluviicola sp.]|nr:2-C-methyl-D-erythritol 4-phosphate cytidylyltransferase [Fluviicola sp.]
MVSVIITAGGVGKRMGAPVPKQFLEFQGTPVLMHTISRLYSFCPEAQLIVTLPEHSIQSWSKLCQSHRFTIPHQIVVGGKERFHSIKNALEIAIGNPIVIHDGVRPFVSHRVLENLLHDVKKHQAVIPVVSVKDSVRELRDIYSKPVNRNTLKLVQTPQVFERSVLINAYNQPFQPTFTDDASVVEKAGHFIHLIEGNEENIKITTPFDLLLAEQLAKTF